MTGWKFELSDDNHIIKISPKQALYTEDATDPEALEIFDGSPHVFLVGERTSDIPGRSVVPSANSCFGPRGVLLHDNQSVWVCDTGHHRLLGWSSLPCEDGVGADILIGQKDFTQEGRNGRDNINGASLNVPTGICQVGDGLAVADAWNHRVLIWLKIPRETNTPADIVLGQKDFVSGEANRGDQRPSAQTLHWPYGVAFIDNKLLVADTGNRRVLCWIGIPSENGQPCDLVLGQTESCCRDENAGHETDAMSMRWPHSMVMWREHLSVCDAGNNRIMIWKEFPAESGQPCDFVLGQKTSQNVDHNQALYYPRAYTLNMPYGATVSGDWLLVADTANSRIIGYHSSNISDGASATALFGQPRFIDKGDNRWQSAAPDSLCWPYAVHANGDIVSIADSGNNRVSIWKCKL